MDAPTSSNKTSEEEDCILFYRVWNLGFSGTFCTVGIAGNIACLLVFYKYRNLAGTLLPLLSALAWADLGHLFVFSLVIVWPNFIFVCFGEELIWDAVVYLYAYVWPIFGMFTAVNSWLVVTVSVHRYVAVIHPLQHARFSSTKHIYMQLIIICVTAVLLEIPRFFEMAIIEVVDPKTNATSLNWINTDMYHDPYYELIYKNIIQLSVKMYVPMIVITYTSMSIIMSLHKRNKVQAFKPSRGKQREVKITKTMLAVMMTFIVTKFPVCLYPIARFILPPEKKTECSPFALYAVATDSISLINSCANFFIYLVAWQPFRDRLLATCACCRCCSCCAFCANKKKSEEGNENSLSMTVQATTSVTQGTY